MTSFGGVYFARSILYHRAQTHKFIPTVTSPNNLLMSLLPVPLTCMRMILFHIFPPLPCETINQRADQKIKFENLA